MTTNTVNISAQIEPDVKEKAENILETLGISTSVLINMLYKQIILTKSIPFSISIPETPLAKDEMSDIEFEKMLLQSVKEANENKGIPVSQVFNELRNGVI